jgi:hypothetical protein
MSLGNSPQAMPGSPTEPGPFLTTRNLRIAIEVSESKDPVMPLLATPINCIKIKKANTTFKVLNADDDFTL